MTPIPYQDTTLYTVYKPSHLCTGCQGWGLLMSAADVNISISNPYPEKSHPDPFQYGIFRWKRKTTFGRHHPECIPTSRRNHVHSSSPVDHRLVHFDSQGEESTLPPFPPSWSPSGQRPPPLPGPSTSLDHVSLSFQLPTLALPQATASGAKPSTNDGPLSPLRHVPPLASPPSVNVSDASDSPYDAFTEGAARAEDGQAGA